MQSSGHYPPLVSSPGRYAFRLLTLEPGSEDDDVVCQLRSAKLTQADSPECQPLYSAVSHAWGPASPSFPIRLGAWQACVREGLFLFLKQVRSPTESQSLWIDALCIDQSDVHERGRQVSIMDKIYSSARRSLVWLGPSDSESILAMEMIQEICDNPPKMDLISEAEQKALQHWSHRPYWTRSWVVQEFLLAREIVVICGSTRLGWSATVNFLRLVSGRTPTTLQPFLTSPAYHLMRQKIAASTIRLPLKRLLVENQHTRCKDQHDKVYAMLGLSTPDENGQRLVPRYDKSLQSLLVKTLEHCHISAQETPRYARFLTKLLKCSEGKISQSVAYTSEQSRQLPLLSFRVGRIVSILDANLTIDTSIGLRTTMYDSKAIDAVELSKMLTGLKNVDAKSLQSYLALFQSMHTASFSDGRMTSTHQLKLVLMLTSECIRPEVLLGLAAGDVVEGNVVEFFLGHEVGMFAREHQGTATLGGCIVCARALGEESKCDPVTRLKHSYWTLQTVAEVKDADATRQHAVNSLYVHQFGLSI